MRLDLSQIKEFEADLKVFAKSALPFAVKDTLNKAVYEGQYRARQNIDRRMINRNKWTQNSVKANRAHGNDIDSMESRVGSLNPYMKDQEEGGGRSESNGVPIARGAASGQIGASVRDKAVRKGNRLSNILLAKRSGGRMAKHSRQAYVFKVQDAVTSGNKFFYHEFSSTRKGIYKVVGGRRGFKRGIPKGAKVRTMYDMSHTSTIVKATHWLSDAVESTRKDMPKMYWHSLAQQLQRRGLFDKY